MYIEKPGQNTSHYLNINENLRLGKKEELRKLMNTSLSHMTNGLMIITK